MKRKLARGIVDRIGGPASFRFEAMGSIAAEKTLSVANHEQMVRLVIDGSIRERTCNPSRV
jgi:hypothetical protein